MKNRALLIFCRLPQPGAVKTRLASELGDDFTAELYKKFLIDILSMTSSIDADVIVYYTSDSITSDHINFFDGFDIVKQMGSDLGARMINALNDSFRKGYDHVVLIGSDSPDLPMEFIEESFNSLKEFDAVIGPGYDGGFYLIGMRHCTVTAQIFHSIEWSTGSVYPVTIENFTELGISFHNLAFWYDIDTVQDLNLFYQRNSILRSDLSTIKFLNEKIFYLRSQGFIV